MQAKKKEKKRADKARKKNQQQNIRYLAINNKQSKRRVF